jgi:hypothetical protein
MTVYERKFPDCDGGWQTYMRQSIPGLGNRAFAEDGKPMKNWWPFLFYCAVAVWAFETVFRRRKR